VADVWSRELEDFDQLREPLPVVAAPLTAAVQLPVEHPRDLIEKVIDALEIASDTVVVGVPAQLRVEGREEPVFTHPAVLTTPFLEARQGSPVLRAGRATLDRWLSPATTPPAKLKSKEFEGAVLLPTLTREPQQVRLLLRDLQSERLQPRTKRPITALGIGFALESTHEVVHVPTQVCLAFAMHLDGFFEPHIQGIVKIDVRQPSDLLISGNLSRYHQWLNVKR
jgi:hypothetical protein